MNSRTWDRKLRDEERKLTKILEELSIKSDIKLDQAGFPIFPSSTVQQVSVAVQTQSDDDYDYNKIDEELELFKATNRTASAPVSTAAVQWDDILLEQVHNDFNMKLQAKDQIITELSQQVSELQQTVLQLIQWKNSTSNHASLLLFDFQQHFLQHQSQKVNKSHNASVSPKTGASVVPVQYQERLQRLHQRLLQLLQDKLPLPAFCDTLQLEAPAMVAKLTEAQRKHRLDRFSTFHHDYDMILSNKSATEDGTHHNHLAAAVFASNHANNNLRGIKVLRARDEDVCGYLFDLLLKLQTQHKDFREAVQGNPLQASSSIGCRLFLSALLSLETIDDHLPLQEAIDIFHQTALKRFLDSQTAETHPEQVAQQNTYHAASASRIVYVDFVHALELCAAAKAKSKLRQPSVGISVKTSPKVSRFGTQNVSSPSSSSTSTTHDRGLGGFIHSWAGKLERFVSDFDFFKRNISAVYEITHPVLSAVLAAQQQVLHRHCRRHMNYAIVEAQALAKHNQINTSTLQGFDVFCINHNLTPALLPVTACRRIAQHLQRLYVHSHAASATFCLAALGMLAQYVLGLRDLDSDLSWHHRPTSTTQRPGSTRSGSPPPPPPPPQLILSSSSVEHKSPPPPPRQTPPPPPRTPTIASHEAATASTVCGEQLSRALELLPVLEDVVIRVLKSAGEDYSG